MPASAQQSMPTGASAASDPAVAAPPPTLSFGLSGNDFMSSLGRPSAPPGRGRGRGAPPPASAGPPTPLLQTPSRELKPFGGPAAPPQDYDAIHARRAAQGRTQLPAPRQSRPTVHPVNLPTYGESSKVPERVGAGIVDDSGAPVQPAPAFAGANQSGKFLEDQAEYSLPPEAEFGGQYSARMLHYLSDVSYASLEMAGNGASPIEVQYGHAFNADGDYQLFASTNNVATQEMLYRQLHNPSELVDRVARDDGAARDGGWPRRSDEPARTPEEHENTRKHALKLQSIAALQERRQAHILETTADGSPEREAQLADLALAQKAFDAFASGEVTVAMGASTGREATASTPDTRLAAASSRRERVDRSLTDKREAYSTQLADYEAERQAAAASSEPSSSSASPPKRPGLPALGDVRHAEQNVAMAMYDVNAARAGAGQRPFTQAEIGGTMIRCMGCTAELGSNLHETVPTPSGASADSSSPSSPASSSGPPTTTNVGITGRLFGTQASVPAFTAEAQRQHDGEHRAVTRTHPVQAPTSPGSPVPTSDDDDDT